MRREEIAALESEIAPAAEAPAETPAPAEDAPAPAMPERLPREQLAGMFAGVVVGITKPLCRRARVTELEPAEIASLSDAIAGLIIVYDLDKISDPRVAAWFGLGATALGVVASRQRLAPPPPAEEPPADQPPPAAGHNSGVPVSDQERYLAGAG